MRTDSNRHGSKFSDDILLSNSFSNSAYNITRSQMSFIEMSLYRVRPIMNRCKAQQWVEAEPARYSPKHAKQVKHYINYHLSYKSLSSCKNCKSIPINIMWYKNPKTTEPRILAEAEPDLTTTDCSPDRTRAIHRALGGVIWSFIIRAQQSTVSVAMKYWVSY